MATQKTAPPKTRSAPPRTPGAPAARAPAPRVYLLIGDDEYGAESAARALLERLVPESDQAFGLERIDGRADSIDAALDSIRRTLEAVGTVGLLGGRKAVWWRGVSFVNHPVIGRNRAVQEALQRLAAALSDGMPQGHVLVVTAPKLDKRTAFFKACEAHGEVRRFEVGEKPWQRDKSALAFAQAAFRRAGLQTESDVLESFVARVGTDTRHLAQETDKLDVYLGDRRTVTEADVQAVSSPWRERMDWDLQDAAAARNLPQALSSPSGSSPGSKAGSATCCCSARRSTRGGSACKRDTARPP